MAKHKFYISSALCGIAALVLQFRSMTNISHAVMRIAEASQSMPDERAQARAAVDTQLESAVRTSRIGAVFAAVSLVALIFSFRRRELENRSLAAFPITLLVLWVLLQFLLV